MDSSRPAFRAQVLHYPLVHVISILFLGLLVYSNTFDASFHLDDAPNVVENRPMKDPNLTFTPSISSLNHNRLIAYITFAVNYRLHGLDLFGYHAVNTGVHVINGLLFYWLVIVTFKTPYFSHRPLPGLEKREDLAPLHQSYLTPEMTALFSALLFVVHPVQTQAVTYISQRFASLATLFCLLSLVMYIKARLAMIRDTGRFSTPALIWYVLCLVTAVLAMKTKEISFTFPLVICLSEVLFFEGRKGKRGLALLPVLLTMLIIPVSLLAMERPVEEMLGEVRDATRVETTMSRRDYLFTQFRVIVTYIRLLVLPVNQNLDYDYPVYPSISDPHVFLSLLFLLGLAGLGLFLVFRSRARHHPARLMAFGIFWFFITLSVESSIIPIQDVIFEHRLYLPSVGAILAFSSALFSPSTGLRASRRLFPLSTLLLASFVLVLSVATYTRNTVWKDESVLWEDVVSKSPNKHRGHINLGLSFKKHGLLERAFYEYTIALNLAKNPSDLSDDHNNLGRIYQETGQLARAMVSYRQAIALNPHHSIAHNNLGVLYLRTGLTDAAIGEFRNAIKNLPDYAKAHYNLGRALEEKGLHEEADREFRKAHDLGFPVPE